MATRNTKLILMFAPLILAFGVLALLVRDMRNPVVAAEQCKVTAIGSNVQTNQGYFIYRQSGNRQHDVSLHCPGMGDLLLNDRQLFITPIKSGQAASVFRRRYQFLPERWMVSVHTGKQ